MSWFAFWLTSALCLSVSAVLAFIRSKTKYKMGRVLDSSKILMMGVAASAVTLFIPIYINEFKLGECGLIETIFVSLHSTIRLFLVDAEFEFVVENLVGMSSTMYRAYSVMFLILFVLAPILTFGFILSFFKNLSAHKEYMTHFFSETFIFSELNEKSLTLAKSLCENKPKKRFFVFTDVFVKNEEESYELIEKAKELGAICFKKDIETINFNFHSRSRKNGLNFFVIGENQTENISQSLEIIKKYKYRENAKLYLFSTLVESEILLSNAFDTDDEKPVNIKVRRVNEAQSLIMRNLYDNGFEKIYQSAIDDGSDVKKINALVIGMGKHGAEMTKALSWFCQMDGYLAEINSFDIDEYTEEKFKSQCPELMKMSGKTDIKGESKYTINIHSSINVDTLSFDELVSKLPQTTYVLVALGDDEKNIATAVKLRMLFGRQGYTPVIQSIVYNTEKKEALTDVCNFRGQKYDIDFIGDIKTSYSEDVILDLDVENIALERHKKWGDESAFWRYDYNYKSSVASAIHRKMKGLCGVTGIDKVFEERTEEEIWNIRILEHCRWNAYMRSEGYIYGGTTEKSGRNDLMKMHNCLVPFDKLPYEEQIKDDD